MAIGIPTNEKYTIKILWGSTSTREENEPCTYEFDTKEEFNAFLEGVEAAVGWMDYEVVEQD
jgi:hypothetical protein